MIHDDLFAEFDNAAERNGWRSLGQPERLTRRYGRGRDTVRVYANRVGTAIVGATWFREGTRVRDLGHQDRQKRDLLVGWLEEAAA